MSHETLYTPALKALAERLAPSMTWAATHQGKAQNRACGDSSTMFLLVEGHQVVKVSHKTRACSICKASANLLCELVTEMFPTEDPASGVGIGFLRSWASQLEQDLGEWLEYGDPPGGDYPGSRFQRFAEVFSGVREYQDRIVCVSLPILALRDIKEVVK